LDRILLFLGRTSHAAASRFGIKRFGRAETTGILINRVLNFRATATTRTAPTAEGHILIFLVLILHHGTASPATRPPRCHGRDAADQHRVRDAHRPGSR